MRPLLNIVTLLLVSLYSVSASVTWGLYYLRADVVAATYCENLDQPSCHGKCHIAKLTSKQNSEGDVPPLAEVSLEKPLLYFIELPEQETAQAYSALPSFMDQSRVLQRGYPSGVFHPPTLLS